MRAPGWRRGARRPPPEIEAEMVEAGRTADAVRLAAADARYRAWLADQEHRGLPLPAPPAEDDDRDQELRDGWGRRS